MLKRFSLFRQTLYLSQFETSHFWKRGLFAFERMLRSSFPHHPSLKILVLGPYGAGKSLLIHHLTSTSPDLQKVNPNPLIKWTIYPTPLEGLYPQISGQTQTDLMVSQSHTSSCVFYTPPLLNQWSLYSSIIESPSLGQRDISTDDLVEALTISKPDLCLLLLHPNLEDSEAEAKLFQTLTLFFKNHKAPPFLAFLNANDLRQTRLALDQTHEETRQFQRIKPYFPSLKWLGSGSAYFASLAYQGLEDLKRHGKIDSEDLIEALESALKKAKIISRKTSFPATQKEQNLEYCNALLQKSALPLLNQKIDLELKDQIDQKRSVVLHQTCPLTSSWFMHSPSS